MTYTFSDLRRDVLQDRMVSAEYFGEVVTYYCKRTGKERLLEIHCGHRTRNSVDDEGNDIVIEEVTATIDKEDLPEAPEIGDRITRKGDSVGYLHEYSGGDQPHYWRRVFVRTRRISHG